MVTARALGGNRRGWYRVSCSVICGGGGARVLFRVRGDQLQATVEAACGWADKLSFNVGK
jgi:hypothetical protein